MRTWLPWIAAIAYAGLAAGASLYGPSLIVGRDGVSADAYLRGITDTRATVVQAFAGLAVIIAAVVGALNLRHNMRAHQDTLAVTRRGQVTERFTTAVAQLASDELHVRLGGIYSLEQIARDSAELYSPIVEILTSYVRVRAHGEPPRNGDGWRNHLSPKGLPTTDGRYTPLKPDLRAILTIMSRIGRTLDPKDHSFNLTQADMRGIDLAGLPLWNADLSSAQLDQASLYATDLRQANLSGAHLSQALAWAADLEQAVLFGAHLQGVCLFFANLKGAFLARADLKEASLLGAQLPGADLKRANLTQADLRTAQLRGAQMYGAILNGAHLEGTDLSDVVGLSEQQLRDAITDDKTVRPATFSPPAPDPSPFEVLDVSAYALERIPTIGRDPGVP
jgi:uncharacterized protein YjbI with pentapeptide repeats